jgi:hypothetical protein
MQPPNQWKKRGIHHLYLGIAFILFGGSFWYLDIGNTPYDSLIPLFQFFVGTGGYLVIDDIVEHTITSSTPLRFIWNRLWGEHDP